MACVAWRLSPFFRFQTQCRASQRREVMFRSLASARNSAEDFLPSSPNASKLQGLFYSVTMQCDGETADSLAEILLCYGAKSCTVEDANKGTEIEQEIFSSGRIPWDSEPQQLWKKSRLTALFSSRDDIPTSIYLASQSVGLPRAPTFQVREVADEDWLQQVQSSFEPIKVSDSLWITPYLCSPPDSEAMTILLDPGLAFGTGEHPTTRLCLRFLQKSVTGGEKIMDYGCGSGILAIAGIKFGASSAVGLDIDPLAIRSSLRNAALNDVSADSFKVFTVDCDGYPNGLQPDLKDGFDIVVANILQNPLLELVEEIVGQGRSGAKFGLSGILVSQVKKVQEAYSSYLKDMTVQEEEGWAFIYGIKK